MLALPLLDAFMSVMPDTWLFSLLDPAYACPQPLYVFEALIRFSQRVVFANTDRVPAPETRTGEGVRNDREALLVESVRGRQALTACRPAHLPVCQIVRGLLNAGMNKDEIGVISPYRAQLQLLQHALAGTDVDVSTVDRFQGRDKDCIVVSLVRCNTDGQVRPDPSSGFTSERNEW
jgi:DNA replication ATP-dependent helicase Dna2